VNPCPNQPEKVHWHAVLIKGSLEHYAFRRFYQQQGNGNLTSPTAAEGVI
jgi:hypothetical protein